MVDDEAPDKFSGEYYIITPQCHACTHWIGGTLTCEAFPGGIPIGILTNDLDHREPIPGDNGIQFEGGVHPMEKLPFN